MAKQIGIQSKHNTKAEINEKKLREEAVNVGRDQLEKVPIWLVDDIARNEWRRIVEQLNKKSLLGNLDVTNLGMYCNAFSRYREVAKAINREGIRKVRGVNPLVAVEIKYSDELKKYAVLLGLTNESKLNLGKGVVEGENKEIEEKFEI